MNIHESTLVLEFIDENFKFNVNWLENNFIEGESLIDKLFNSNDEKINNLLQNELPEIYVFLNKNNKIRSQVLVDYTADIVYPVKNIEDLIKKYNKKI